MFEDYLNDTCNIYHLVDEKVNIHYGIKATQVKTPEKEAAEKSIPCHFHIRSNGSLRISQKEPYTVLTGEEKLTLPIGTDVRMNDVIENCRNGVKYRAGLPREIHGGHHIIVTLSRDDGMEEAI